MQHYCYQENRLQCVRERHKCFHFSFHHGDDDGGGGDCDDCDHGRRDCDGDAHDPIIINKNNKIKKITTHTKQDHSNNIEYNSTNTNDHH